VKSDTTLEAITPRLLTVKQASAYCGATVWALRRLYWAKELPGIIVDRRLLVERVALDAGIDAKLAERGFGETSVRQGQFGETSVRLQGRRKRNASQPSMNTDVALSSRG
jgi:hypothetical protein